MCTRVVLDASAFDVVNEESPASAGAQLRHWIGEGHGRVAYSTYDRCGKQLKWDDKVWALVRRYSQSGLANRIADEDIEREEERLRSVVTRSGENDRQMLALAAASDARVMVVKDGNLTADFEDVAILPKAPGYRRRALPIKLPSPARNDFLHRRRCSRRLPSSRS